MILLIFFMVLVLVVAYVHYLQGFFSATLSAILAIISAAFALSFHETIIESLLGGAVANFAHGVMLMLLFAGSYSILRGLFDKAIPGEIRVPFLVDKIGGALMGIVAGIFCVGIIAIAVQEFPFGPVFMGYARYDTQSTHDVVVPQPNRQMAKDEAVYDEIKSEQAGVFDDSTKHTLYVDDAVVNMVGYLSNGGSLAGSQPLIAIHPDLLQELFGQRLGIEPGAKRVAMNLPAKKLEDVKVPGLYSLASVTQGDPELPKFRSSFEKLAGKSLKPSADSMLLVVRVFFARSAGDTDGLVRLSTGAVRIAAPADASATQFVDYHPLGVLQGTDMLYLDKLDDFLFVKVKGSDGGTADFVFLVKKDGVVEAAKKPPTIFPGVFLEVKRLARVDLAGQKVLQTIEASPTFALLRKPLVIPETPPVVAVNVPPPAPTPAPAPIPEPAPTTPPPSAPSLHSPQEIVKPAGNGIIEISGAAPGSSLPIAISCGDGASTQITLPGGDAILKNGKFLSLNLDVQETQEKLSGGARPVKDLLAKDSEGLIIVSGTAINGGWAWAEKADQINIVDSAGKQYPVNGVWADVDQGGQKRFFARYSTNYPVSALTAGNGKVGNVWLCFSIPAGAEVKQVVSGTQVLGEFPPVKAEGQ